MKFHPIRGMLWGTRLRFDEKGFCGWLGEQGYARVTIRRYVSQASHLSGYLESRGLPVRRSLRSDAKAFVREHLPVCRCDLVGLRHDKAYGSLERLFVEIPTVVETAAARGVG